ncbi:FBP domain-containing protein [Blastococcus sp. URHD0036]|uniref:FBP domain-containing protein n=1 Tax=Blastococcus sp. URHD0036 TaxID=1380356 RepID=UPI000495ED8B|nr:FBP domain-containing protein [Blastococcus sp. URHD0036]
MEPLTEPQIRRSFVNCSKGEANAVTLPRDLDQLPWADLELLGWRDAKAPLRGYLVVPGEGRPVGISLRAADTKMSGRTAAMCLLCQTAQPGDAISLFTARRVGEAGRNGNTVGTYICADLGCAQRVRTEIPQWLRERDPDEVVAERTAELRRRVHGFLESVQQR